MDKIFTIPIYHLLTNFIPGAVLALLLRYSVEDLDILSLADDTVTRFVLMYFLGLVCSRVGSLVVEPLLKATNIIQFSDYKDYLEASKVDKKIDELNRSANEMRSYISVLFVALIVKFLHFLWPILVSINLRADSVLLLSVFILFILGYKKQVDYVRNRVKNFVENKNKN